MPIGSKFANFFLDCLVSKSALRDWFFDYLWDKMNEAVSSVIQGQSGVLASTEIPLAVSTSQREISSHVTAVAV